MPASLAVSRTLNVVQTVLIVGAATSATEIARYISPVVRRLIISTRVHAPSDL